MSGYIKKFICDALAEDLGTLGDITTDNIFDESHISTAHFNFREKAVVTGIQFAREVFMQIDPAIEFTILKTYGEIADAGETAAVIKGSTKAILKGERLALNILQRLSGIATNTRRYAEFLKPYGVKIADTRKTTPLFRYFEKYAVKTGGGVNHRFGLYDAVMIKDNHIAAAGGITSAVRKVKNAVPHTAKIEVEAESYSQALEALEAGADIIMLDNMRGEELKKCVKLLKGKVSIEASGMINFDILGEIASAGVDIISSGSIIYNAKNIDIGLDFE
jgi:nicotinate-nucleotide pyrophosphorylase (carboxylating)